jgi:ketosteroid isomerase-like protein
MSQENVDVARRFYAAWNAGDMTAIRELYDPDVVVRTADGWPEPGPYVGRETVLRWFAQLQETWDAQSVELVSLVDAGDRIVVRQVWHGSGHGPESTIEFSTVTTLRNGKTILVEYFWDHTEALEAVGLSE